MSVGSYLLGTRLVLNDSEHASGMLKGCLLGKLIGSNVICLAHATKVHGGVY